jgi:hypothetical protein
MDEKVLKRKMVSESKCLGYIYKYFNIGGNFNKGADRLDMHSSVDKLFKKYEIEGYIDIKLRFGDEHLYVIYDRQETDDEYRKRLVQVMRGETGDLTIDDIKKILVSL